MGLTPMWTALLLQPESCNVHQCLSHPVYYPAFRIPFLPSARGAKKTSIKEMIQLI